MTSDRLHLARLTLFDAKLTQLYSNPEEKAHL